MRRRVNPQLSLVCVARSFVSEDTATTATPRLSNSSSSPGEPVEASEGRAAAEPASLSQSRSVGVFRCREGAHHIAEVHASGAASVTSRREFAESVRTRRNAAARRNGQPHYRSAGSTDAHQRGKCVGAGSLVEAVGREQPLPGAWRRMDAERNAGVAAMRSEWCAWTLPFRARDRRKSQIGAGNHGRW